MIVPPACGIVVYPVVMLDNAVNVPLSSATALWTVHAIPVTATTVAAIPVLKDMPFSPVSRLRVAEIVRTLPPAVNACSRCSSIPSVRHGSSIMRGCSPV